MTRAWLVALLFSALFVATARAQEAAPPEIEAPAEEPATPETPAVPPEPAEEPPAEPPQVPELLPQPEEPEPALRRTEAPRQLDPLEDAEEHRIWARMRGEVELVDVEGAGGFRNRDTARVGPARRSAYVDIDKITFSVYTRLVPWFLTRLELRADADSARMDRVYLEVLPWTDPLGRLRFQLGQQVPMIEPPDRHVETRSPQANVFWRGREWHAGGDFRLRFDPLRLRAVLSLALTRPLADQQMGEDESLPSIAFGHYVVGEDTTVEGQALVGASVFGATVEAFGAYGELLDNQGPDTLMRTYADYAAFGPEGATNHTSIWGGVRAYFEEYGIYVLGELIFQQMGFVERRGWEANGSYTIRFDIDGHFVEIEPFFRYAQLTITNLPQRFEVPETWDREQMVFALLLRPFPQLEIKAEYLVLNEAAGTSVEGMTSVADNQFLLQFRVETGLGVLP